MCKCQVSQDEREHSICVLVQDNCRVEGREVVSDMLEPALLAHKTWFLSFQEFSEPIDFMLVA